MQTVTSVRVDASVARSNAQLHSTVDQSVGSSLIYQKPDQA